MVFCKTFMHKAVAPAVFFRFQLLDLFLDLVRIADILFSGIVRFAVKRCLDGANRTSQTKNLR